MVPKKYCAYFPYRLDIEELEKVREYEQLATTIKNFIYDDAELENRLATIKKFVRFNQEQELSLLEHKNKIFTIVFSRDGYKPFNILPVINDLEYIQCFVAVSLNWFELKEINANISNLINEDADTIKKIYELNKHVLLPYIESTIEKLFQQYLVIKEREKSSK